MDALTLGWANACHKFCFLKKFSVMQMGLVDEELVQGMEETTDSFLELILQLKRGGEVDPAENERLLAQYNDYLGKVPDNVLKLLPDRVVSAEVLLQKFLVQRDARMRKEIAENVKEAKAKNMKMSCEACTICMTAFCNCANEDCARNKSGIPCPCAYDVCNKCWAVLVVRTARRCRCSNPNCSKFKVKCPCCRRTISFEQDEIIDCQQTCVDLELL